MSDDLLPMETLERLSRQDGVDTRPILVRVLTDLFIQKERHAPEDIDRYQELMSQLLDVVAVEARAAVARRLADEPRAPRSVIDRLISDDISVAAPILARSRVVPRDALLAIALDGGVAEASAVASRADVDADMIRTLAFHADPLVAETLAGNAAARFDDATLAALVERATADAGIATALLRRGDLNAASLAPLYLQAEPQLRAAIRNALAARPGRLGLARTSGDVDPLNAALLAAATETGLGEKIAAALAIALDLKPDEAALLAVEPSAEVFVLMLRAAGVDSDLVARALLVTQPDVATSVVRFFHLVEIAETTSRAVAAEIVAALTGAGSKATTPRHDPVLDPSGVAERPGALRPAASRRPASRPDVIRGRN